VWAYVPRPTPAGAQTIDRIRQQFTDAADPATVDAVVALSIAEIHVAITELTKAGMLRPKRHPAAVRTAELPDAGATAYRDAGEPLPGGVPANP
jgi:hypothetical protein